MTKRKIAIVITRMVPGGAANIVRELIRHGSPRYSMALVTGPEDRPPDLRESLPGVPVHVVDRLRREISPVTDLRCLVDLARLFRRERFDVIHTHTSKAGFLGRFAAQIVGGSSIIHSTHGSIYVDDSKIPGIPQGEFIRFLLLLERVVGRQTDVLTTLSMEEREHCIRSKLALAERIRTIYNGVDLSRFLPSDKERCRVREELEISDSHLLIVSAGRLTAEKGHSYLVRSFCKLYGDFPNIRLVFAGDGPEKAALQREAESADLARQIMFLGHRSDIPALLAAADVFALPSVYEGFGLAVLEAMAAGVPVVATNVGGIPDVIRAGQDGVLVERANVDDLADGLRRVASSSELREKLSTSARSRAQAFSLEAMLEEYFSLYEPTGR